MMNEGQFLQDVYIDDDRLGGRRFQVGGVVRWGYHPRAHLTETDAAAIPDARERLIASWAPYWDKSSASAFVEKSPSNVLRTRFLQSVFPGARFIIVTRNPIVQALAVRKWAPRHVQVGFRFSSIVAHWLTVMETFRSDVASLNHVRVVPYEKLIRDPSDTMNDIFRAVGAVPERVDVDSIRESSEMYVEYWKSMGAPGLHNLPNLLNPLKSAKSVLPRGLERIVVPFTSSRAVREISDIYGDRIRAFGYDTVDITEAREWM